MKMICLKLQVN